MKLFSMIFAVAMAGILSTEVSAAGEDCEVCIKVIQDIRDMLDKEDWSKKPMVEEAMGELR